MRCSTPWREKSGRRNSLESTNLSPFGERGALLLMQRLGRRRAPLGVRGCMRRRLDATDRADRICAVFDEARRGRRRVGGGDRQIDIADHAVDRIAPALDDRILQRAGELALELHTRQFRPAALLALLRRRGGERAEKNRRAERQERPPQPQSPNAYHATCTPTRPPTSWASLPTPKPAEPVNTTLSVTRRRPVTARAFSPANVP